MLKKMLSVIISATLMTTALATLCNNVLAKDNTTGISILMNGEALQGNQNNEYIYTVNSLERLPVLTCNFPKEDYTVLISQPSRENGYVGTVTLISIQDNSTNIHTVRVYDNNTFKSHFINSGADPWVTYHNGYYYYMTTGNSFFISRSRDLSRVNSNPVLVCKISDLEETEEFSSLKELWAPELHFIEGHWYIFFTAYDGGLTAGAKNHRMYVLESATDDPYSSYTFKGQIKELEEDYINDTSYDSTQFKAGHYAIDQSVFKWNGKLYSIWSGWSGYTSLDQRIYIAEMSNPYTISSRRVELSRPEYAYETYSVIPAINEGPQALISPDGNTLNIAFSVNRFDDPHYSLALLTLKSGGNPLDPDDWTKTDKPVFETNTENSTYSVGHCSFVPSPDNSDYYIIYHARRGESVDENPREVRVQQFFWDDSGKPVFENPLNADAPVQIPSGTAILNRDSIEAEAGELLNGALINENNSHYYSGGKRVALTTAESTVAFKYTAEKEGLYTISLLASGNSAYSSGFKITVNDAEFKKQLGGNSSNINNFFYYDLENIELLKGENVIIVAYSTDYKNGGYLDRIDILNNNDAELLQQAKDNKILTINRQPIIRKSKSTAEEILPDYNKEYTFNSFGDFDKYWFSTQPFITDPYYSDVITTCRAGGNKRLFITGDEFKSIADFKSSVEIIPAAAHENSLNPEIPVTDETGINSGILFRVGKMLDYTKNVCTFDGYRCFLTVSGGVVKLQLSRYYFASETATASTNKVLKTSAAALPYTPGDTYILEIECIDETFNAKAYNKNSPENIIEINEQSIVTTAAETLYSGKIGLFVNCSSRVSFANMKVTPYFSAATESYNTDFDSLQKLSSYTAYAGSGKTHTVTEEASIKNPSGVSKLILNDTSALDVEDFTASAKIKLIATNSTIQSGFAFRVSDVTTATPGLTGYALFLQRTSTENINQIRINLTKYGNKNGTLNANLGNQTYTDSLLLSDITNIAEIIDLEFNLKITVQENYLKAIVSRADKPELYSNYEWELDSESYAMNKSYPVYYTNGNLGIFSNGSSEFSNISFNILNNKSANVTLMQSNGGNAFLNNSNCLCGDKLTITLSAEKGYYINKINIALDDNSNITVNKDNLYWDTDGVYSFTLPKNAITVSYSFLPIKSGDCNGDDNVDVLDIVRAKKYTANNNENIALSNADIDQDKKINSFDLAHLRKKLIES